MSEDTNKIIKHSKLSQAFTITNENNDDEEEVVVNDKIEEPVTKPSLQKDEFSYKKNKSLNRFDQSYYEKNNTEEIQKEQKVMEISNNEFKTEEKKKEPTRKSYFSNDKNTSDYRAFHFKVIMLGSISVGKTCFLSYFIDSVFKEAYACTVGVDFKVKTVVLDQNLKVDLQIWDTSGEERFRTITRQYYRDAAGIILIFDVTNEKSFSDIATWIDEINLVARKSVNIILVGNKADLEKNRVISYETANRFAMNHQIEYFESSAKTGHHVSDVFEKLAGNMVNILESEESNKLNSPQEIEKDFKSKGKEIHLDSQSEYSRKKKKKNCC